MNRDDIIRMAREAADVATDELGREFFEFDEYDLERFAALVAAEEREACARVCEELAGREDWEVHECAAAIRARGGGLVRKTHQSSDKTIRARGEE